MKRKFLKFLYYANKQAFHDFLIEDFVGEIPREVQEPALTFLANGKIILQKWVLFHAHLLQRRIVVEPKAIERNQGMLLYLKLFQTLVTRSQTRESIILGEESPAKRDDAGEAIEAAMALQKKIRDDRESAGKA